MANKEYPQITQITQISISDFGMRISDFVVSGNLALSLHVQI